MATIHDVLFMRYPKYFSALYRFSRLPFFAFAAHRASAVLTVSEAAASDIARYLHVRRQVDVIYNGADTSSRRASMIPVAGLSAGDFILTVGRVEPRKNYPRLIAAFADSAARRQGTKLVIVGFCADEFAAEGDRLSGHADTVWLNGMSDGELNWLFANARAFILPSIAEGFGIPAIEALHAGLPTAVSDSYPLADVKDVCITFDALDTGDVRRALDALLDAPGPTGLDALWQRYSWYEITKRYVDVLRRVASA